jgi:FtsZ-interacting cell division protein ZipA
MSDTSTIVIGVIGIIAVAGIVLVVLATQKKKQVEEFKKKQVEEFKKKQAEAYRARIIKEKFNSMNNQIKTLKGENAKVSEKFTKLASCPGVKERYCTCTGSKCSCGNGNEFKYKEKYQPASVPVRPEQNMVAGAIGKAKKLKAEAALRGAAPGLPMPTGSMFGKEAILSLDGVVEAFTPNRGRY